MPSLLDASGYFPLDETEVAANAKIPEVELELTAQINQARAAGIQITHLDSHMSALMGTPALIEEYQRLGREQHLPILWHAEAAEKFGAEAQPRGGFVLNDDTGNSTRSSPEGLAPRVRKNANPAKTRRTSPGSPSRA